MLAYLLASLRIGAWLFLVPPFAGRTIPVPAKVVLAVGLAFAVGPSVTAGGMPTGELQLLVVAFTQVLIGASLGFVATMLLAAIAAAGSLIDVFGGFALATGFDPLSQNMNTIFGKFHQLLATMLLFATGGPPRGHRRAAQDLRGAAARRDPEPRGPSMLIEAFTMFFMTAVQIALPMIAVLFIADLGLALLTKVAPQMNALNVMFPAKIGLTLLLVGLSFPVLPQATDRLVELVNEATAAIAGGG